MDRIFNFCLKNSFTNKLLLLICISMKSAPKSAPARGKGKMRRIFAPLMGAAWTYASLSQQKASAPSQLTAGDLKEIEEILA